jgi:hypothetical protein
MVKHQSYYRGYLSPYVERIRATHRAGADTRAIAEALYALGARTSTIDLNIPRMQRTRHISNLRLMVLHVLQRDGLRTRHRRIPRWPRPSPANHEQV